MLATMTTNTRQHCALLLLYSISISISYADVVGSLHFKSIGRGIGDLESDKTSPPSLGDLNQDGWIDIVMSNHVKDPFQIFYGGPRRFNATTAFPKQQDRHGTAIGDFDSDGFPDILMTVGGTNGKNPVNPVLGKLLPTGGIESLESSTVGLDGRLMRGVAARFVDIDSDGDLDLFVLSRPPIADGPYAGQPYHSVYKNNDGKYTLMPNTGIEKGPFAGMTSFDFDMDGIPDILLVGHTAELWRGDGNFKFSLAPKTVFPRNIQGPFSGVAAFDYDNDGDKDLFIGGGYRGKKGPFIERDDILFENRDGILVDVTVEKDLPMGGAHVGITFADFNNDGFLDIFVPREGPTDLRIQDLILLSNRAENFVPVTEHGANGVSDISHAVGAQVFDFDRDGRQDVIVAARHSPHEGKLVLYRNRTFRRGMRFVYIILPSMDSFGCSTMDAKVELTLADKTLTRWAGPQGEFRTSSFVTDVHFGLGRNPVLISVRVTLSNDFEYEKDLAGESLNSRIRFDLNSTSKQN